MRIKNKTLTIILCLVVLAIGSFMSWGQFKFGLNTIIKETSGLNINIPNLGEAANFGDELLKSINKGNSVNGGNIFVQSVNAWKSTTNIAGVKINNWIPVVLGLIIGFILLLVDLGAIKMSMIFPRILLLINSAIVGVFVYFMFINKGLAIGSILSLASLIVLLLVSFTLKSYKAESRAY